MRASVQDESIVRFNNSLFLVNSTATLTPFKNLRPLRIYRCRNFRSTASRFNNGERAIICTVVLAEGQGPDVEADELAEEYDVFLPQRTGRHLSLDNATTDLNLLSVKLPSFVYFGQDAAISNAPFGRLFFNDDMAREAIRAALDMLQTTTVTACAAESTSLGPGSGSTQPRLRQMEMELVSSIDLEN